MKYVIIRDDDISYFTKPEALTKLYGLLFEEEKSVNFSVIPQITANIRIGSRSPYRAREKIEYDPCIPPIFRGRNEEFPLNENRDLVEFLRNLENCEILQHGLTHGLIDGVQEFRIKDKKEIQRRADFGSAILEECFHSKPSFFVPPWDKISLEAIRFLKLRYKGLSIGKLNPIRLSAKSWGAYIKKTLASRNYMFYDELLIIERSRSVLNRFNAPDSILSKVEKIIETNDVVILVNHYWEYFFDWSQLNQCFFEAWEKTIEYLLQREDLHFLTFSELYNCLYDEI